MLFALIFGIRVVPDENGGAQHSTVEEVGVAASNCGNG